MRLTKASAGIGVIMAASLLAYAAVNLSRTPTLPAAQTRFRASPGPVASVLDPASPQKAAVLPAAGASATSSPGPPSPAPSRKPPRSHTPSRSPITTAEPSRPPNKWRKTEEPEDPTAPWVETNMAPVDPKVLLSVSVAYFNQASVLKEQLERWGTYSAHVRSQMEFVVVDDGSKTLAKAIRKYAKLMPNMKLQFISLDHDIGFNQGGACNTGALHATGKVYGFLDIDHWYTPTVADRIVNFAADMAAEPRDAVFFLPREDWTMLQNATLFKEKFGNNRDKFNRWNLDHSSPNCAIVNRETFWKSGGYDEDFSGAWGWVDLAFRRCLKSLEIREVEMKRQRQAPEIDMVALYDSGGGVEMPKYMFGSNYDLHTAKGARKYWCNNYAVARVPHTVVYTQEYDASKETAEE